MIWRVIIPTIVCVIVVIWTITILRSHCPAYSHRVMVDGQSYCFDNGHYNVDGE